MTMRILNTVILSMQWSFGVILWELVSLGKKPYQDLDEHTLESHLLSGYRLGLPKNCPDQL